MSDENLEVMYPQMLRFVDDNVVMAEKEKYLSSMLKK